ncbi:MAG: hypothetical protein V4671_21370 [Armatimonadota bacterium]
MNRIKNRIFAAFALFAVGTALSGPVFASAPACCAKGNCCAAGACCTMPGCCKADKSCCDPAKGVCTSACGCAAMKCCGGGASGKAVSVKKSVVKVKRSAAASVASVKVAAKTARK